MLNLADIEKQTSAHLAQAIMKPGPDPPRARVTPGIKCVMLNRMCTGDQQSKPLTVIASIECKKW